MNFRPRKVVIERLVSIVSLGDCAVDVSIDLLGLSNGILCHLIVQ
jgi:hypothetical protein